MNPLNQIQTMARNLAGSGQYRMIAILGSAALAIAMIAAAALYFGQTTYDTLYVGLKGDDVTEMSTTLGAANIPFKIGKDGASISVPTDSKNRARMLLADRGLPSSTSAGYELFDKVGSLGLTSFMQKVTRVRALQGEIARTIESIDGITGSRVHIVMADRGNFRTAGQKPTASVMIRADGDAGRKAASSIRHLVAASVPGLSVDDVTVLDQTGRLLASGEADGNGSGTQSLSLTQNVQSQIENNIERALSPVLGMENFRTSVTADLDTDAQKVDSVVYDPDSKVVRSVRTTKESENSDRTTPSKPATVDSNLPQAQPQTSDSGPKSTENNDRKEEQTNYEINSTRTHTERNGFRVEKLSVAVMVNRARVAKLLGGKPTDKQIDAYVQQLKQTAATAAGLDDARGDKITISAMSFLDDQVPASTTADAGLMDSLGQHTSGIINAIAFVLVAFLVVWFGLRPLARSLQAGNDDRAGDPALPTVEDVDGLELPDYAPDDAAGARPSALGFDGADGYTMTPEEGPTFNRRVREGPEKRLARMVEINEERAAKILRKWAAEEEAA
ncbi:flagellar basal-body MS-ring/collar protein FliF [Pararhizobium mangrovi]|uniref:Flagellar M-ring protein n=1 Tax=Pararhizobium mangrovi TaxID=2590452 RepID=A0A506U0R0_9HYPH|nr:flagellar basal-body MS-ring/collar protein FliF [Pararhizobium mangrovi]TPW26189.1 flagellar M-ring protein FliF [Pararhizobium mangrovi]